MHALKSSIWSGLMSNERLHGSMSNERLHGLMSNERLHGLMSNERLHGSMGNERLHIQIRYHPIFYGTVVLMLMTKSHIWTKFWIPFTKPNLVRTVVR